MRIEIDRQGIESELETVRDLIAGLNDISDLSKAIKFLTIEDVSAATGWNVATVRELFLQPDFPSCDFGKAKIVEIHALLNYFSVPRRRKEVRR